MLKREVFGSIVGEIGIAATGEIDHVSCCYVDARAGLVWFQCSPPVQMFNAVWSATRKDTRW